jgi:hypothetical protein
LSPSGSLCEGILLLEKGLHSQALDCLFRLLDKLDESNQKKSGVDSMLRASVLITIGETFCQINNPSQAVQFFLKALTFSQARYHEFNACVAKLYLAMTQYLMDMPNQVITNKDFFDEPTPIGDLARYNSYPFCSSLAH